MVGVGTTVGDAIEQALNRLRSTYRETFNVLDGEVATGDTTITVLYDPQGISVGATLGLGTEDVIVATPPSGKDVTVLRAQHGTSKPASGASHADGLVIQVKPSYSKGRVLQALLEEIRSWPPHLFKVGTPFTLTTAQGRVAYDLGKADQTELLAVLGIWDPTADTTRLGYRTVPFRRIRRAPTALSSDADSAVVLSWTPPDARTLTVEWAAPFDLDPFVEETDLVTDVGLVASMFDVAWMGAAYRLLQEGPRTELGSQTESRKTEEVPPGHITSVRRDLEAEYRLRKNEEMQKLVAAYGSWQ